MEITWRHLISWNQSWRTKKRAISRYRSSNVDTDTLKLAAIKWSSKDIGSGSHDQTSMDRSSGNHFLSVTFYFLYYLHIPRPSASQNTATNDYQTSLMMKKAVSRRPQKIRSTIPHSFYRWDLTGGSHQEHHQSTVNPDGTMTCYGPERRRRSVNTLIVPWHGSHLGHGRKWSSIPNGNLKAFNTGLKETKIADTLNKYSYEEARRNRIGRGRKKNPRSG